MKVTLTSRFVSGEAHKRLTLGPGQPTLTTFVTISTTLIYSYLLVAGFMTNTKVNKYDINTERNLPD